MRQTMSIKVGDVILGDGVPKICVPIVAEELEQVLEEAKVIESLPADLVEWRIDWLKDAKEGLSILSELREILGDIPLLLTFRTAKEGGKRDLDDITYIELYKDYLATGQINMLDVELSSGDKTAKELIKEAHKVKCKVIMSSHDFFGTPDDEEMISRLCHMQELGADVTKLAVMPKSRDDVERLLFVTTAMKEMYGDRPFVTMSMGELGMETRINGAKTGSAMTFGSAGTASAPGQIDVKELDELLNKAQPSRRNERIHLFLIGFMGSGKSTIARALSKRMDRRQIEMDEVIVRQEGMPVTEIFETKGEEHFRRLETQLLLSLKGKKGQVISCGGGVPMRPENVEIMRSCGVIVRLNAKPETIFARVKHNKNRPILNGNMNIEFIEELMEQRREAYEAATDLHIDTDGKSVGEIVKEILKRLKK